jgi:hypothetical protein
MLGIAVCWSWTNILRESLAGSFSVIQFFAENWIFTVVAAFCILLWVVATWERFRYIGASEFGATACTAALVILWGYVFYWRMRPLLALGLFLVSPLPSAIASAGKNQHTDEQQDSLRASGSAPNEATVNVAGVFDLGTSSDSDIARNKVPMTDTAFQSEHPNLRQG